MPAKPSWLLQIPQIVTMLESFDVPVVDRAVVERLFQLRRRRAIELMHRLGGYQAGRTFLVDRQVLIERLRRLAAGEDCEREGRRRARLQDAVAEMRRYRAAARVQIPVPADVCGRMLADLSTGVALEPGHLHVVFSGAEELLGKLYELAQVASNDFDRFRAAVEPAGQPGA
jgi:hypothetical protein